MKDNKGQFTPVYRLKEIVKKGNPREKVLHRNMLYPFRSVQETQNPLLTKCNILMDIYFQRTIKGHVEMSMINGRGRSDTNH